MTISAELMRLANGYVSGEVNLSEVSSWLNDSVEEWVDGPEDSPEALLRGFMQVRIYQHDDGVLDEVAIRADVGEYLRERGLLQKREPRRATG